MSPSSYVSRVLLSYVDKVKWVIEQVDYCEWSENQIDQQYSKLRKQLNQINSEVAKAIQKINFKTLKKHKISQPDAHKTLQIRSRQIDNNHAIIQRLTREYQLLQKRASCINSQTKDNIQSDIDEAKKKLNQMKSKIKQLKLKNKNVGNSIVNTDNIYDEIRRLEQQKQVQERKRSKLEAKNDKILQQIAESQIKTEQIADDYYIAENYFEQYHGKQQICEQVKRLQKKMYQTKHALEVCQKKLESINNSKQQKYHSLLKNLENQVTKIKQIQQKTSQAQLQAMHKKKMIEDMEALLRNRESAHQQSLIQETAFFTEFDDHVQKNVQDHGPHQQQKKIIDVIQNQQQAPIQIVQNQCEQQIQQYKINQQPQKTYQPQNTNNKVRLSTNGADLQEQQRDIMQINNSDIDEKFKYGLNSKGRFNKTHNRTTKNNDYETEMDESNDDVIIDENDKQIIEFKQKICEQKRKSKLSNSFKVDFDLQEIQQNLRSANKVKSNSHQDIC